MPKVFAKYQYKCSDKIKKVLKSGGELPKVINTKAKNGYNLSFEQE